MYYLMFWKFFSAENLKLLSALLSLNFLQRSIYLVFLIISLVFLNYTYLEEHSIWFVFYPHFFLSSLFFLFLSVFFWQTLTILPLLFNWSICNWLIADETCVLRDLHFICIFADAIKSELLTFTFQSNIVRIWAHIKLSPFYYNSLTNWH